MTSEFLNDIRALSHNFMGEKHAPEDVVDALGDAIAVLNKYKEQAQSEICDQVEELIDSFGGKDCTMRQLKGE